MWLILCRKPRPERSSGLNCGMERRRRKHDPLPRRPREQREPITTALVVVARKPSNSVSQNKRRGVWVPAFAGTTRIEDYVWKTTIMQNRKSTGCLTIGASDLEYRMIGPAPGDAPTIVMLHEGLGSAGLWGDFPEKLQAATGAGVFVYSRAGYGASTPAKLPRPLDYMHIEALDILPKLLDEIGFRRGLLLGHSDAPPIAPLYPASHHPPRFQPTA